MIRGEICLVRGFSALLRRILVGEMGRKFRERTYFSVQASTAIMVWRDVESRHQVLERVGRFLRER